MCQGLVGERKKDTDKRQAQGICVCRKQSMEVTSAIVGDKYSTYFCVGRGLQIHKQYCPPFLEQNGDYWELTSVVGPQELGHSEERVKEKMRKRNASSQKVS